ncbi:MAG TPA: chemotaxis protein CheW [Spirochaetota bacterium]|nr:chemotaxis protein CheW [Spirochaetota bacterium]
MKGKAMNKYVTFKLGDTRFAVAVLKTREIVEYGKITPVPEAPEYIEGVINLRGSVVPVVNLSKKFFGIENKIMESTSIMIVEPEVDGEQTKMGLIVDLVSDVLEIKEDKLEPPPKYGSKLKSEYLLNVTSRDDEFILILDIDKVMSQIDISKDFIASEEKKDKNEN